MLVRQASNRKVPHQELAASLPSFRASEWYDMTQAVFWLSKELSFTPRQDVLRVLSACWLSRQSFFELRVPGQVSLKDTELSLAC